MKDIVQEILKFFKRTGGTTRAIRGLAIWAFITTLFIMGILWIMPRKKNYTKLHLKVAELERVQIKIDCGDYIGEYGSKYRVCCGGGECWETLKIHK